MVTAFDWRVDGASDLTPPSSFFLVLDLPKLPVAAVFLEETGEARGDREGEDILSFSLVVLLFRDEPGVTCNDLPNPTSSTSGEETDETPDLRWRDLGVVGVVGVVDPELEEPRALIGSKLIKSIGGRASLFDLRTEVGVLLGVTGFLAAVGVALSEVASLFLDLIPVEVEEVRDERVLLVEPRDLRPTTGDDLGDPLAVGVAVGVAFDDINGELCGLVSNERLIEVGVLLRAVKGEV